jgi:hypothetical protein
MERQTFHRTKETPIVSKLRDEINANSKPEFYSMLEIMQKEVTIDALLGDRVAQAKLDVLLSAYGERSERGRNLPMVVLKEERDEGGLGATVSLEHHRFQLNDNEYLYYFSARQPKDASKFLRDKDVVPVEEYEDWRLVVEDDFRKPINRVPMDGGVAQRYNYHSDEWEENGQGTHTGRGTWNNRIPR